MARPVLVLLGLMLATIPLTATPAAAQCSPPQPTTIIPVASVLPIMRSVQAASSTATYFATIIAAGTGTACGCSIAPTTLPANTTFLYQTTNTSNQLIGSANTPVDIAGNGQQSFLIAMTPGSPLNPTEVRFSFKCANTPEASLIPFVNSVLISSGAGPNPDIIALAATQPNPGIVNIPGPNGTGAFSVATVNACDRGAPITVSGNTAGPLSSGNPLPVNVFVCQTNPSNGNCLQPPASSVTVTIAPGETPTFSFFVAGKGANVPFDPANNRVYALFKEGDVLRGATSVAVRTQ
jgi:hypothetical protein